MPRTVVLFGGEAPRAPGARQRLRRPAQRDGGEAGPDLQQLLGIDNVGVHDCFFELGGDSLIGVQVLSRIKKELGAQLASASLYEGPTLADLAVLVTGALAEETTAAAGRCACGRHGK